jgi:DNA mismatch repair protein MutS2
MHGEAPTIDENGYLDLRQARHPLIDSKKVVPINVSIGKNYSTLVITGPNTGGKTVTLKTMGLLAMMAQSGLHIPAADTSRMPVFRDIFADIGDEQSIEQSLSTFSSHMRNTVELVEKAGLSKTQWGQKMPYPKW